MNWIGPLFRKPNLDARLGSAMLFGFALQAFVLAELRDICLLTGGHRALADSLVSQTQARCAA